MATNKKLDAENLTPAQKGARTRAANKAKAAKAAAAAEMDAFEAVAAAPETVKADVPAVIDEVTAVINGAADNPDVVLAVTKVTTGIPARVRSVIYTIGTVLGIIAVVAGPVAAALTGDAQALVISIGGLAQAFTSALAKLNLSKTATDIAFDSAKAVG